jgi:hypothetical protein
MLERRSSVPPDCKWPNRPNKETIFESASQLKRLRKRVKRERTFIIFVALFTAAKEGEIANRHLYHAVSRVFDDAIQYEQQVLVRPKKRSRFEFK